MATSTVEDYLKRILLEESDSQGPVRFGAIAVALDVAPGTVTAMMKTLADSGLVEYEPYAGVRLSPAGRQLATHVLRRHRLIELFLVEVVGLDWSEVHAEAERLEHAVSDRLIERIDAILGSPSVDPHGDPIPDAEGQLDEPRTLDLLGCPTDVEVEVVRVLDQQPAFLQLIEREGLKPGSTLTVETRDEAADTVELKRADGSTLSLGRRAGSKILVAATTPVGTHR